MRGRKKWWIVREKRCHRNTNKGLDSNRVQESRSGLEDIVEPLRVMIWWDLHCRVILVTAEKSSAGETRSRRTIWILGQPLAGRSFEKHCEGSSRIASHVQTAFDCWIPFCFFSLRVSTSYARPNPLLMPWPWSQRRKTRKKSGVCLIACIIYIGSQIGSSKKWITIANIYSVLPTHSAQTPQQHHAKKWA